MDGIIHQRLLAMLAVMACHVGADAGSGLQDNDVAKQQE